MQTEDEKRKYESEHPELKEVMQIVADIDKNNTPVYLRNARKIKIWMDERKTTKPPSSTSKSEEEKRLGDALHSIRFGLITCLSKNAKYRNYSVRMLSELHKNQQEFEETEYFKNTLRYERYKIEAKNGETKQAHGLCKTRYVGLKRMCIQSYLTHIVANLKRIILKMDNGLPA